MAERIVSPGVFTREQDTSFLTPAPAEVSTAVVGPTVKGPINIPTVVRSYGEYVAVYGDRFKSGSDYYQHLTALTAEKYFEQGGDSLLVTRVADGSFGSAEASVVTGSTALFTLETIGQGTLFNNSGSAAETLADGALLSGSADNVRWEVTGKNKDLGTFSLIIRRGDDNHKSKIILETFNNLSLDPNSDNYIAKRIGDVSYSVSGTNIIETGDYANKSAYVRVKSVGVKMPDYFDNAGVAKAAYSQSIDDLVVGSGSYHGAFEKATGNIAPAGAKFFGDIDSTDTQGLAVASNAVAGYSSAITLLGNKDEFNFNVLLTPGLIDEDHSTTVRSFVDLVEDRGDAIYVADLVVYSTTAASSVVGRANTLNSSFAAAYWPWVKVLAQGIGKEVWTPASVVMGGVYAFNDAVSAEWFAPAGLIRGGIPGVIKAERKLSRTDRDTLYSGKVNPLATFPGSGVVAYGQKTLQTKASALDRVNVRRLLITLKRFIGAQANNLVFEQNTIATRNRFLSIVNPYLENVIQRQGLYAFRVVMDDTNNTADVIDRNQLVGQIFIQPTKTAEFIVLDFVVEPTGAAFGA
jgi:uncharacterized protein